MDLIFFKVTTFVMLVCLASSSIEGSLFVPAATCGQGIKMDCSDCYTSVMCDSEGEPIDFPCGENKACQIDGSYSSCVDVNLVPDCQCSEVPSKMPDKYDTTKYILCLSDGPHVQNCPDGTYNQDTESCSTTTITTTTEAISTASCSMRSFILLDCAHGQICLDDGSTTVVACKAGDVINVEKQQCIHFEPFSCPLGGATGLYPDNINCSVFHFCSNSVEQGSPQTCPTGKIFDPATETCIANTTETVNCPNKCLSDFPSYIKCEDNIQRFKIDCKSYYQCTDFPDGSLHAVSYECPGDFVYNDKTQYCDLPANVPECA